MDNVKLNYVETKEIMKDFIKYNSLELLKECIRKQVNDKDILSIYIEYINDLEVLRNNLIRYDRNKSYIICHSKKTNNIYQFHDMVEDWDLDNYKHYDKLFKSVMQTIYTNEYSGTTLYDIFNRIDYINYEYYTDEEIQQIINDEIDYLDFD